MHEHSTHRPVHRYTNLQPYRIAKGRAAESDSAVVDRFRDAIAVVSLADEPSAATFLRCIHREMKIRCYSSSSIKSYIHACRSILRWFGRPPHLLDRENVRRYLEYLCDAGHGPSDMGVQLSAIRTAWDKMCFRDVTLGLETPRPKRRKVVVASREEIRALLNAAHSLRNKLMIGLMYGTGMRVSELCTLKWRDIDQQRNQIFIRQGKGKADRHVQLPQQYKPLLSRMSLGKQGDDFIFPTEITGTRAIGRHIAPRSVQRAVKEARQIAGIQKKLTPHSLRHAFATHSFEDGCDIRRIQAVLGHVNLETTTIYVSVAQQRTDFPSPLDRLAAETPGDASSSPTKASVGTLRVHSRRDPSATDEQYRKTKRTQVTLEIKTPRQRCFLTGIIAEFSRPGFLTLQLPPIELWEDQIRLMPPEVQKRVGEASFYEIARTQILAKLNHANE